MRAPSSGTAPSSFTSAASASGRTAYAKAIATNKTELQAQKAYDDCEDIEEDLTFDEWRHAIVDFDEEWQEQRGVGPPTSADNSSARLRVQALFDNHHALAANMAIGLTGAPEPPPRATHPPRDDRSRSIITCATAWQQHVAR